MKRNFLSFLFVGCLALLIVGGNAANATKVSAKTAMARYLVIAPHDPAQCLTALEEVKDAGMLAKWDFGCEDGDHTGYMIVSASSAEEALKNVPASQRGQAKAVKVHKFTAAELKSAHEKMKM